MIEKLGKGGEMSVTERVRRLPVVVAVAAAALVSLACLMIGRVAEWSPNILWAPTDLPRSLVLLGVVAPWAVLVGRWLRRERGNG